MQWSKLYQADKLVPRRMARRTLGFTTAQIEDMEAEDKADVTRAVYDPAGDFGPKPESTPPEASGGQQAQREAVDVQAS